MSKEEIVKNLEKELNFLYKIARTVHSLEIEQLLKEIVKIASKITQSDSCLIYTLDVEKKELILRASKNPHPKALVRKIIMKLGEGITGWVAKEKKVVIINSGAYRDKRFKYFPNLPEDRFEGFLSVPIMNKKGVIGVINVQHKKKHKYLTMEINLLTAIGKLVGGAVDNALLMDETHVLKETLQIRKVIDKAKGILMQKKSISEDQAYRLLQKESMNSGKLIKDIAEAIIMVEKINMTKRGDS